MTTTAPKKLISIVIPVYNEEENVRAAYSAVNEVFATSLGNRYDWEFVFTDNRSTDRTFPILVALASENARVRVLRFSKNFGYQKSIWTGYCHARGDAAIQIDCDLQDPPELIPEFLNLWEQGNMVVYGVRRTREEEPRLMHAFRKCFYRLVDFLSEDPLPLNAGDFRLIDRKIMDILKQIDDRHPYLRGTIAAIGFRQIGVPYDRRGRQRGQSKFDLSSLVSLAVDGILNHSIVPLRIATVLGIVVSALTVLGAIAYVVGHVVSGQDWPRGFTTITVLILISLGVNALLFGIIGEYVGRMFQQMKNRPVTIIEDRINL